MATGRHYFEVLADLHLAYCPEWYLEVGVQTGKSLALSNANSVGVDPEFKVKQGFWDKQAELHLHEMTSDAFFESGILETLDCRFRLAFLDGMHLYEYLLRDFMNAERYMRPDGCIVLHDCLPSSENMAERDRSKVIGRAWTGDVWKVVAILKEYRPDLTVRTLDAAPTGLVIVTGLDPQNRTLSDHYDEIITKYDAETDLAGYLSRLTVETANDRVSLWPSSDNPNAMHVAIKTSVPEASKQESWGDHHFARGLKSAIEALGHTASVRPRSLWKESIFPKEVDLTLTGLKTARRRRGHVHLQWMISSVSDEKADHTFIASAPMVRRALAKDAGKAVSYLPQAFDADRIPVPVLDQNREGLIFVGIARPWERPVLQFAIQSGAALQIWGSGWDGPRTKPFVKGTRIANTALWKRYAAAEVVLNDHTPLMREHGFVSNRIFDALACATPVISDRIDGLPDDIAEFVDCVSTQEEFDAALARIRSEDATRKEARRAFALRMRTDHSFDARAAEIVRIAAQKLSQMPKAEERRRWFS